MKTNPSVYSDKVRVNSESASVRVRINDIWPYLEYNFFSEFTLDKVHKYNGSWRFFGKLKKTRAFQSSLFLNGSVLIIGGGVNWDNRWQKTEIWDMKNSEVGFEILSV